MLTVGTSGIAAVAYLLAWALIPALPGGTATARERPRRAAGSWRIATGVALLALSVLLAFRELGFWWSDALVWPLTLAAFGVALLWSLSRPRPEAEPPPEDPAAPPALAETEPPPAREQAGRLSRRVSESPDRRRRAPLPLGSGSARRGRRRGAGRAGGHARPDSDLRAVLVGAAAAPDGGAVGADPLPGACRSRRPPPRLGPPDACPGPASSRRPAEVARLARHQERELRSWLAGSEARPGERLADALRAAAEEVEESHGAPVEAVVVGDAPLDERLEALVSAAREALTNAAKFASDGGEVRLYAEIENGAARVFVDDRGPGFDPEAIPTDRRGVRESIIGRMQRHGGRAEIRSAPESGTEVELEMEASER